VRSLREEGREEGDGTARWAMAVGERGRRAGGGERRGERAERRVALRGRSGRLSVSVQAGDAGSAGFWAGGVAPLGFGAPRAEREAVGRAR